MKSKIHSIFLATFCLIVILFSAAAGDNSVKNGYGIRAGLGVDPDQFVIGVQSVMGRYLKIARFAPSIDIGIGNDLTIWTFNPDLRLRISPPGSNVIFYGQAGPTIAIIDPKRGDGDTEIGLTISGGLQMPLGGKNYYNLEGRVGIGDVPDFRILFGVLLGGGKSR